MQHKTQKAFTMIELIFAIVIIGILSSIAIPKFSVTRDDAIISKARNTVASVRNAMAIERQKRVLRGNFAAITDLALNAGVNQDIFDFFDNNNTLPVLEYPLRSCVDAAARGCWIEIVGPLYRFRFPHNATDVDMNISNNKFDCIAATAQDDCDLLTQ